MTDKVKTGRLARGEAIHVAVYTKTVREYDGTPYRLFRPSCQRLGFRNVSYLLSSSKVEVTCKKCLAKLTAEHVAAGFETLNSHDHAER